MNLAEMYVGQRVFDRQAGTTVTVRALGDQRVLCLFGDDEIAYDPAELDIEQEYPELVLNVYRPNPLDDMASPGRLFQSMFNALNDPEFHRVFLQVYVTKTGMAYSQPVD